MGMTPGPWEALSTGNAPIIIQAKPPNQPHGFWHIATIATRGGENEANARAIAALPLLVEALQTIARLMGGPPLGKTEIAPYAQLIEHHQVARAALVAAGINAPTATDTR